jgi:hypothetical protein
MPRVRYGFLMLTIVILLYGCFTGATRRRAFKNYIDRPVPTRVDGALVKCEITTGWKDFWLGTGSPHACLVPKSNLQLYQDRLREIPAGTPVIVRSAKFFSGTDHAWYIIRIELPSVDFPKSQPAYIEWDGFEEDPLLGFQAH